MQIKTLRHDLKWSLAVGVHLIGITAVAAAYWSHRDAKWVPRFDQATLFETEAAALVYRRGNLARMTQALADLPV